MGDPEDQQAEVVASWHAMFKRGADFDTWGQPLEAKDNYQSLAKQLHQFSQGDNSMFTDVQKKIMEKIAVCLDSRCKSLQNRGSVEGISLEDLRRLESTLKNLVDVNNREFPVDVSAAQIQSRSYPDINLLNFLPEEEKSAPGVQGNLFPRPIHIAGKTLLTVKVEKIGLKDASQFIDPYISVSVKDPVGKDLTVVQDTPLASDKQDTCIFFNVDVHIQKTVESLPPGFAIFFEFKHYKPKKKSTSTRCWAFLEKDEIKEGCVFLELYKKPTDFRRKKVHLLTVKPLYLHLKLSLFT